MHFLFPNATSSKNAKPAEHRIGVHVVDGVGRFYDQTNGTDFAPRGSNYVHIGPFPHEYGATTTYHILFNVGRYQPGRAEAALRRMHADGYNIVRVFLIGSCYTECLADPQTGGLSKRYVDNVVDFLFRAKKHAIYVMPIFEDWSPPGTRYRARWESGVSPLVQGLNVDYLTRAGLEADTSFAHDLIRMLIARGAPLDAIFAYELRNELFFQSDQPPFNLPAGSLTAADGKTYDLARSAEKNRLLDDSLVYWIDAMREAIRSVDPTALVSVGFFWPQEPNPTRIGDSRLIHTRPAIERSSADFIDLHPYPGFELTFPQYMENFGVTGPGQKPLVMGEFGAATSAYSTAADAAGVLQQWQASSCAYGFTGWLFWTWDMAEDPALWTGASDTWTIERALAPRFRPDPCAPPLGPHNLALGQPVTASRWLPGLEPSRAVDGLFAGWWGAGDYAPQWLEIDLGTPQTIARVRLVPSQWPAGETIHRLLGASEPGGPYRLLHGFAGWTADSVPLDYTPPQPWQDVRIVRIETVSSPSWVSWREVEIYSPG